jgi:hypothetical protein
MGDSDQEPAELVVVGEATESQPLGKLLDGTKYKKYGRFVFAALSSIPWIGGLIGASAAMHAELEQGQVNELMRRWLEEHRQKINLLGATLSSMTDRLEGLGAQVEARLQEESYLSLVRQGFHTWDEASTESKRDYVRRTLTNAASTRICSDDVVRIFLDWIDRYDEAHFRVIRALFRDRGATRADIWDDINGADVREDSAEADLFKLLIHDLSMGHVLRQIRATNDQGQFLARRPRRARVRKSTLESAFEDTKPYELTALGTQFVTYVLNETVPRIGGR